ncbi:hypothetical protein [Nonomuraea jiangxiensis]|uniref:Alpha-glucoside transport system substrate-binding protein n=1 Tax=Nonomuraea jiangxiensis TaxID=633440 RepID=A0A1G8LDU1_9ACTN|nr:hypothetical protein [Nonomuraea jiangxiensis]SDI53882.1 alpha-glucoside transport system substrate-binding protein [Nonomuraea jiangxiensis]
MPLSRRGLLAAIPAVALAGCGAKPPLRVAVVWSGDELGRFLDVVKEYDQPVRVYSAGDNIGALLRGPATEVVPDVAVIPRLGLLFDPVIRRRVRPLNPLEDGEERQPKFWRELVTSERGQELGVWFKVAHKSLVWHRVGEAVRPADLDTWRPVPGDLSIGAADGWVLSDWFENVLLASAPEVYAGLFPPGQDAGNPTWWDTPQIEQALKLLAEIWKGAFPREAARRALTKQFHDSILDVFAYGTARMVAAPDFALPVIERFKAGGVAPQHFPFPGQAGRQPPLVVGGDVAVALHDDARPFVDWLTRQRAAGEHDAVTRWVAEGGFLTPFTLPTHPLLVGPAQELHSAVNARYDLSDRLIGTLEGGDGRGLWRVLTELFSEVTVAGADPGAAAEAAREKLAQGSREGAL